MMTYRNLGVLTGRPQQSAKTSRRRDIWNSGYPSRKIFQKLTPSDVNYMPGMEPLNVTGYCTETSPSDFKESNMVLPPDDPDDRNMQACQVMLTVTVNY